MLADLRVHDLQTGLAQAIRNAGVDDEQLLIFRGTEAVEQHCHPPDVAVLAAFRFLGQHSVHQNVGDIRRAAARPGLDAGLTVDAETDAHPAIRDGEQRMVCSGQRASGEGHPERPGPVVGAPGQPLDLVQGLAFRGGGTHNLEDE